MSIKNLKKLATKRKELKKQDVYIKIKDRKERQYERTRIQNRKNKNI